MNFVKLKNKIVIENYKEDQFFISYGSMKDDKFYGIQYFTTHKSTELLYSIIPEKYRKDFNPLIMKVNRSIPPHTDSGILTTINVYVKPDSCFTKFFRVKDPSNVTEIKVKNQTNGSIFKIEDLIFENEFFAEKDDVYLLDVTKPHAVIPSGTECQERIAVCLQTDKHDFETVKGMLLETGNI